MKWTRTVDRKVQTEGLSDTELLALFHHDPVAAWATFIERFADVIFSYLCHLGFDYDRAMEQFVYVCEKLCEQDFRRLKTVRYAGQHGDLTPWLRAVVKNLSVNWLWSVEGRKRLLKPIARLPLREQRIFELYFWKGLTPAAISQQLQLEHHDLDVSDVLEALETIFSQLSQKKLWRLLSNLSRLHGEVSLDEINEENGFGIQISDDRRSPEAELLAKETDLRLAEALAKLTARERLIVQLRYEDGRAVKEIAEILRLTESEVKGTLQSALRGLRRILK